MLPARTARGDRWHRVILAGLTVLPLTGLAWFAGNAAFLATTSSEANSWSTGSVALTDDDGGSAMFGATGLLPGQSGENCITVSYGGDSPTTVRLYAIDATDTATLSQHLDLVIEEGTGGGFGDCTGFTGAQIFTGTLASFASTHTAHDTGVGTWAPAGTEDRVYRVAYTLNVATPDSQQGQTGTVTFQWRASTS